MLGQVKEDLVGLQRNVSQTVEGERRDLEIEIQKATTSCDGICQLDRDASVIGKYIYV
jgi:hypothetical protein